MTIVEYQRFDWANERIETHTFLFEKNWKWQSHVMCRKLIVDWKSLYPDLTFVLPNKWCEEFRTELLFLCQPFRFVWLLVSWCGWDQKAIDFVSTKCYWSQLIRCSEQNCHTRILYIDISAVWVLLKLINLIVLN